MNKYPKRLIEVDLPIKRISDHARREKSIRYGHISTLHIWWARRPLAACRAVICASLWPDPGDDYCPESFRDIARMLMLKWANDYLKLLGNESYKRFIGYQKEPNKLSDNEELRYALLDFIADFSNWDNSNLKEYLDTSRSLTDAAHQALGGGQGTKPLVVDPFAGGGSIPLEALRIGADVFSSDLNPVAVLLNKVILEYIPKYGEKLADEVRKWGEWVKAEAEKELIEYYPTDLDGVSPIAYLWSRTIQCEGPGCGAEVPLLRTLWLAKKGDKSIKLKMIIDRDNKRIDFEIQKNKERFRDTGTIVKGAATCPLCGYTTPVSQIRSQLNKKGGGAKDARLVAIRQVDSITEERGYRLPNQNDYNAIKRAEEKIDYLKNISKRELSLIPDEPLPPQGTLGFRIQLYGMKKWGDLFTPRQLLALLIFSRLIGEVGEKNEFNDHELARIVQTCLALCLDRLADFNSSLCVLNSVGGRGVVHTFGRQALPMVWDFMETNPFNEVGANWSASIEAFESTIKNELYNKNIGRVECLSATSHILPDKIAQVFFTDPPYYDAVPYADLSDFFYVWLRRTLPISMINLLNSKLSPKAEECIVDISKQKDRNYFENAMSRAMSEGRRILTLNGVGVVVFAHKSTSGWEAQLQAMINAGWVITGSWPIDTERPGRLRAQNSAALASSIHLICRPRESLGNVDNIGDWRDVLYELPKRLHSWLPRLAGEGIIGADAIFACLGPALEIFSQYSQVEKASGDIVTLREYLEHVWAAVAKEALNMIFEAADASGFEEDARLTAMWLWTLSTTKNNIQETIDVEDDAEDEDTGNSQKVKLKGFFLEYDAARKIAQGLGIHLEALTALVEIKGDTARLIPVIERESYLFESKQQRKVNEKSKKKQTQLNLDILDKQTNENINYIDEDDGYKFEAGSSTLDRLHQSMLLFADGRSEALKRFLVIDGHGKDQRFWSLAQALSALYPSQSDEKRWVDGVLARKKSLIF
jgi:putative DNA methylase